MEKIGTSGLSDQDSEEAQRLYYNHKSHSASLDNAKDVMQRADDLRARVAEARTNGTLDDISFHDQVFANGESTQNSMVFHAKLHHDANLWQAKEHYLQNQESYIEQARIDAEDAGVDIVTSDAAKRVLGSASLTSESEKPLDVVEHPKGYERQYTGVCDVVSPDDVRAMLSELRNSRADSERRLMVGIMTHPAVINPDAKLPDEVRHAIQSEFPSIEQISQGFIDDPDVMNTIHYADLYGPNGPRKAGEAPDVLKNLELCVEHGGPNLDAIQLDLVWPDPDALLEFRRKHPDIEIVLQLGKFSFGEDGKIDEVEVTKRLSEYGRSVDHVLLDLSMGKGRQMTDDDVTSLKKLMWAIQDATPDIGLAIAGGLGAGSGLNSPNQSVYSMESLRDIARDFPGVSIDAQGGLKPDNALRDDKGHFISTAMADSEKSQNYVGLASEILDGEMELGNHQSS